MKNKGVFTLLYVAFISMHFYSCSVFDPASPTASYIQIDSVSLLTDYATQGSNDSKITDVWVFYDKKYLGTFPLPAVIPLLNDGTHEVSFKGGIIQNGILGSRAAYPMYAAFTSTMNLTSKDTVKVSPALLYASNTQFPQMEDFDDASLSLTTTNANYAQLTITPTGDPDAYEGNSGKVTIDGNKPVFEVASSSAFPLPLNVPVYVELNYKCDVDFSIGSYQSTQNGVIKSDLLSVRASSVWKKIYVTFSELGGVDANVIDYKVYIHAEKGVLSSANLFFDNFKVLY